MNRVRITLTVLATLAAGCGVYFDDDDDCDFGGSGFGAPAPEVEPPSLRDPLSGECQTFGPVGGGDPCDQNADRAPAEQPDWAACFSGCTGMDEQTCVEAVGCRAIYQIPLEGDGEAPAFSECWATAPSGPIQGGNCLSLDAYECSRHDDCIAYHQTILTCDAPEGADCAPQPQLGPFLSCGFEDIFDTP